MRIGEPDRAAAATAAEGVAPAASMRYWSASSSAGLAAVLLFVLVFVGLSLDIMARVWDWRAKFGTPLVVGLLLYLEAVRALVTLAGMVIALLAAARARSRAALGPFAFGVAFATIAYTKLVAFAAFAGAVQERSALWLRARGVSQHVLGVVFAHPEWAGWLALAAFLLFAARYPRQLSVDDIARSGARDRTGAMRSVALAGADVGRLARAVATGALRRGWLRGVVVWSAALVGAVAHTAALRIFRAPLAINLLALLIALAPIAALIALLRASYHVANDAERAPLIWLRRGAFAALLLFALSALATQLLPQLPLGALTLSVAPAALAACWLVAVLRMPRSAGAAAAQD